MSGSRRAWIAGAAALLLVLLPFGIFVKTNYKDGSFVSINFIWYFLETAPVVFAAVGVLAGLLYVSTSRHASHAFSRAILTAGGAFFLLFFYHYPYVGLFPEALADWIPAGSYLLLVALVAALLFMLAKHSAVLVTALFFATANLALTLPSIVKTTVEATQMVSFRNTQSAASVAATDDSKPNVYYFILDAYGNVSSLRENLDYDNMPFIKAMEGRGFYHAERAISSYNRTLLTLASIFAQD